MSTVTTPFHHSFEIEWPPIDGGHHLRLDHHDIPLELRLQLTVTTRPTMVTFVLLVHLPGLDESITLVAAHVRRYFTRVEARLEDVVGWDATTGLDLHAHLTVQPDVAPPAGFPPVPVRMTLLVNGTIKTTDRESLSDKRDGWSANHRHRGDG